MTTQCTSHKALAGSSTIVRCGAAKHHDFDHANTRGPMTGAWSDEEQAKCSGTYADPNYAEMLPCIGHYGHPGYCDFVVVRCRPKRRAAIAAELQSPTQRRRDGGVDRRRTAVAT